MKNTKRNPVAGAAGRGVKYIDHPDLHDPAEVTRLIKSAEGLLAQPDRIGPSEEMLLFKAMYACINRLNTPDSGRKSHLERRNRLEELHKRIIDHLFQANIGLVYEMRRRSRTPRGDDDGLNSEGFWALYQAIRGFDPWRGYRFSTYACTSILRAFLLVARTEARRKERMKTVLEHPHFTGRTIEENSGTNDLLLDRLSRAVSGPDTDLTPTERFVIQRRFLQRADVRPETLESIGKLIKVSKERVRQIQLAGLAKLRTMLRDDPLFEAQLSAS